MELVKLVRVIILIMNLGSKSSCGILFAHAMRNDVKICMIQIDQKIIMTYTSYLFKFQFSSIIGRYCRK